MNILETYCLLKSGQVPFITILLAFRVENEAFERSEDRHLKHSVCIRHTIELRALRLSRPPTLLNDLTLKRHLSALISNLMLIFVETTWLGACCHRICCLNDLPCSLIPGIFGASLVAASFLLIVAHCWYHDGIMWVEHFLMILSLVHEEINLITVYLAALIKEGVGYWRWDRKWHHYFMVEARLPYERRRWSELFVEIKILISCWSMRKIWWIFDSNLPLSEIEDVIHFDRSILGKIAW